MRKKVLKICELDSSTDRRRRRRRRPDISIILSQV